MLDQLPHEVISAISSFLTLQDKLILITTCRHLFDLISTTNLYSELVLFEHSKQVEEIINKFTDSRYPGSQVKRLIFNIDSISDQLLFQLATIFPNITEVRTAEYRAGDVISQDRYTKGPMLQWRNTLQKFDLMHDWREVLPVLKTTTFPRLTVLTLSKPSRFADKKKVFDTSYFLPVFKNVPSLKKLTLEQCSLDLYLLEEIHANCHHLKSLVLKTTQIIIGEQSLPSTIQPAISLLYMSIFGTLCFDINGLLLEYITRKYRSIKQLLISLQDQYNPYSFIQHHGDESGRRGNVTREYLPLYKSLEDELENSMAVYKESGSSFFSSLTTTIESITIDRNLMSNTIQAIAYSSIDPVQLHLWGRLEDPLQILYFEDFKKLKSLEFCGGIPEQIYNHNFTCSSLTKLTIKMCDGKVCIDWLLKSFPFLQELYIEGEYVLAKSHLTTTDNSTNGSTNPFPNLCKLTADVTSMSQACVDFLIQRAPNMKMLNIIMNSENGLGDITFDISDWELKELNLTMHQRLRTESQYCNITTKNAINIIEYNSSSQRLAMVKNDAIHGLKKEGKPNIVSNRERKIKFNGFSIFLYHDNVFITFEN